MVKFAPSFKVGEYDGIEWLQKQLCQGLVTGESFLIAGVVSTKQVTTKKDDLVPEPTVEVRAVEAIPMEHVLADELKKLLEKLYAYRVAGADAAEGRLDVFEGDAA